MGAMNDLMIDHMNVERRNATFFSRITANHWTAKNKLEAAAHELAFEMDRKLIPGDKVQDYFKDFEKKINELCAIHHRCKPLKFSWLRGYTKANTWALDTKRWSEWWIYCDGVFQISLVEVKEDE